MSNVNISIVLKTVKRSFSSKDNFSTRVKKNGNKFSYFLNFKKVNICVSNIRNFLNEKKFDELKIVFINNGNLTCL